jgi:signal transduction histidine kinase
VTATRKDGTQFPAALSISMIIIEGQPLFISILSDATEQREKERQLMSALQQAQQGQRDAAAAQRAAEQSAKAKAEFLSTISREIRGPASSIAGFANLLCDSGLSFEQQEAARAITRTTEAMTFLLNNAADFARIEAGELSLERAPFSLKKAMRELVDAQGPTAGRKGLVLNLEFRNDTPDQVIGDPSRIAQVVGNILDNAVASTEGGYITLLVSAHRQETAGNRMFSFSVEDTRHTRPVKAPDPRYRTQLVNEPSGKRSGEGLMMSITRKLVALMGGDISFISLADAGTVVTATMPLGVAPERAA